MECLGFEPGTTGWKAYMNPLSYGGRPQPQVPLLLFNSATSASETQVVRWIESNKMSKPKVPIENTCLKIFGYAKLLRFFCCRLRIHSNDRFDRQGVLEAVFEAVWGRLEAVFWYPSGDETAKLRLKLQTTMLIQFDNTTRHRNLC